MSKLMEKLRREAKKQKKAREERSSGAGVEWFSAEKGDNIIRILPHWKNPDELFFKHIFIHYGIELKKDNGESVTISARCLRDFDEDCPICDVHDKVIKKDKDKAKELRAAERYLYNVIDYKNRKVCVYNAPTSVHQGIMEWVEEFDTDVSDIKTGRDMKIRKVVDPKKPPQFGTSYRVIPSLKESAIPAKVMPLTKEAHDLDTVYTENHRESMEALVSDFAVSTPSSKKKERKKVEEEESKFGDGFMDDEAEVDEVDEVETAELDDSLPVSADDDLDEELKRLGV